MSEKPVETNDDKKTTTLESGMADMHINIPKGFPLLVSYFDFIYLPI